MDQPRKRSTELALESGTFVEGSRAAGWPRSRPGAWTAGSTDASGPFATATLWALAGLLLFFLVVPVAALIARALSTGEHENAQTLQVLRQALGLSLGTTAVTMATVVTLGTPLAYLLARRRFAGATAVEALVDLPIVLPPAVAGIALLVTFGRNGLVGRWLAEGGVTLGFTTIAVVMAQVFVSAPFYVIAARGGFARVDSDVEAAAADLGAPPGQ